MPQAIATGGAPRFIGPFFRGKSRLIHATNSLSPAPVNDAGGLGLGAALPLVDGLALVQGLMGGQGRHGDDLRDRRAHGHDLGRLLEAQK